MKLDEKTGVKIGTPFYERVRVLHHGNGETTYLGGPWGGMTQIPTEAIPPRLRLIGSEFLLEIPQFTIESGDGIDAVREICASYKILDIAPSDDSNQTTTRQGV